MKWLWGDKKQEKTPVDFSSQTRKGVRVRERVRVHLELDVEAPQSMNVIQALRDTKVNFDLPPGVTLKAARYAHIEMLGDYTDRE